MLKILQARLQQYVNCELPDVQASFCYAQSPSPQNWENKTSTAMQKHEGVLFLAQARAPTTSNAVEWSKEPQAQIYSSIYRF